MPNLVLSRKPGETIVYRPRTGPPIILTVVSIDGNKVRLMTQAEPSVQIWRGEMVDSNGKAA